MRMKRYARGWRAWTREFSGPAVLGVFNGKLPTQAEVGQVLETNAYFRALEGETMVESYATNQFAANNLMEDRSAEARLISDKGLLFGVFDGHSGHSCAEVLSRKLFNYIATALLPETQRGKTQTLQKSLELVKYYRECGPVYLTDEESLQYDELQNEWTNMLNKTRQQFTAEDAMTKAFLRMDADIGKVAERKMMVEPAMSGAVACVALIRGRDLYVAGTGDCGAVLGHQAKGGGWTAIRMTNEHTVKNPDEYRRLKSQHPPEEEWIVQNGRLFGSLAPLRAFGDFRYKWPVDTLERVAVPTYGRQVISANYRTPPYLTALPEVMHREISSEDKFLVLATDGLWNVLSPEMVVQLIGDHKSKVPTKLKLKPQYYGKVSSRNSVKECTTISPDCCLGNPSTYVLRAALGGSFDLVSHQLSIPLGDARNIRDDITVTIVFFKSDEQNQNESNFTKAEGNELKTYVPENCSRKVSELGKDKTGSMTHSAEWEDIENAGKDVAGGNEGEVDLDQALRSGGVIRSRSFTIPNKHWQSAPGYAASKNPEQLPEGVENCKPVCDPA